MNTTRRTNVVGANGKTRGPLCPFKGDGGRCMDVLCELYNDDARGCALSAMSLQMLVRTAITDAAVEIGREMRREA